MAASIIKQGGFLSYPTPPGDKRWACGLVQGPASYTQITTGTPATGGFIVKAADIGLTEIEWCSQAVSDDGRYVAFPIPTKSQNAPQTSVAFVIIIAHTGAEETGTHNCSANSFLFFAMGN
jgi:hypothetical protein